MVYRKCMLTGMIKAQKFTSSYHSQCIVVYFYIKQHSCMTCLNVQTTMPLTQREISLSTENNKQSPTVDCSTARAHSPDFFYHYSFTHINDQNKWQSLCKEETKPTKGSLTAISTTDVFTEGCLLSAEQSHTWETPKSFREMSRKPTCKFVTATSPTGGSHQFYFFSKKEKKKENEK